MELVLLWKSFSNSGPSKIFTDIEKNRISKLSESMVERIHKVGYIKIVFSEEVTDDSFPQHFNDCVSEMKNFFKLSTEIKRHSLEEVLEQGLSEKSHNFQNKVGYGSPSTFPKEYFLFRNLSPQIFRTSNLKIWPTANNNAIDNQNENNITNSFYSKLRKLFNSYSQICCCVGWLLLDYIGVPQEVSYSLMIEAVELIDQENFDSKSLAFRSMMECFKYKVPNCRSECPTKEKGKEIFGHEQYVGCFGHSDVSLITAVAQCIGCPGLELFNWSTGLWRVIEQEQIIESKSSSSQKFEVVIFPGDELQRISNGFYASSQHRVVLNCYEPSLKNETEKVRYSIPFELNLSPFTKLKCNEWLDTKKVGPLTKECSNEETVMETVSNFSRKLISANR